MKVFVPTIGSDLILTKSCTVTIHSERRNWTFLKSIGMTVNQIYADKNYGNLSVENQSLADKYKVNVSLRDVSLKIPAGTVLSVNRIYIRQGAEDFDSMTFFCKGNKDFPKGRFWLKLTDVNNFEIKIPTPVDQIQTERKTTSEENQKKKNIALYNKVQRYVEKIEKQGKTLDGLVSELIRSIIDENDNPYHKRFYSESFSNSYDNFKKILKILGRGEGDSIDRSKVSDFLYKLEHSDSM